MSGLLNYRWKLHIHIAELVLIHIVLGISGARLTLPNLPKTRANTIALGFSAKSLMFIFYQLGSTYVKRFQKYKSYKAFTIINGLEIVFWAAVCFLIIQANIAQCDGTGCILSWIVVGMAIPLAILSLWAFAICYTKFKQDKAEKLEQQHAQASATQYQNGYGGHAVQMESSRQWSESSVEERLRK